MPLSWMGTGSSGETVLLQLKGNQWEGCVQRPGTHEGTRKDPRWPWGGPCRKGACSDGSVAPRCCAGSLRTRPRWPLRWPGTRSCQSDSGPSGCYSYKLGKERSYWEIQPGLGSNRAGIPPSNPCVLSSSFPATPPSFYGHAMYTNS